MKPKKTTLRDIARELNLCVSSVGCALSDRSGNTSISEKTRQRVREAARRLNYQSNSGARTLRTQRYNNIGYFIAKKSFDFTFTEPILDGLSDGASEHGQSVVVVRIPESSDRFGEIPRELREQCLDALVIYNAAAIPQGFQNAVEASGIPVVYLNEKKPTNSVYVNDSLGGRLMTEHLVQSGFRRITMFSPDYGVRQHYSFSERVDGYLEVMKEAGLPPDVRTFKYEDLDEMHEQVVAWLTSPDRPEVIFCRDDQLAMYLQKSLYTLGIRIPDDMALAGCNGELLAHVSPVPLTTLEIPFRRMAYHAVTMAIELANAPEHAPLPSVAFNPSLVVQKSTQRVSS